MANKIILSGNSAELKTAITQVLALKQMLEDIKIQGGSNYRPLPIDVKGTIILRLYFTGSITNTIEEHFVEKSFRLVKDNPQSISLERLKSLANKVKSKFLDFKFTTGYTAYAYNNPAQGFNRVWGFFNTQQDAQRLYEQMLDLDGNSPDWSKLTKSSVVEPGDRFTDATPKVTQAGQLIKASKERPIALMRFNKAVLKFPHIKDEVDLALESGWVLNDLKFLDSYKT